MPDKFAFNPYNFVPIAEAPERKPLCEYYNGPLESGWIDVRLTVKTPLIIPDGASYTTKTVEYTTASGVKKTGEHKVHSFFRRPGEHMPTIPGSSLRGMLRSVYEAASNSCLPFVEEKPITQRSVTYSSYKNRGLLAFDSAEQSWKLFEVDCYRYKAKKDDVRFGTFRGFDTAERVWFFANGREFDPNSLERPSETTEQGDKLSGILQFNIPAVNQRYNVAVLTPKGRPLLVWKLNGKASDAEDQLNPYQMLYAAIYDTLQNISNDQEKRERREMEVPNAAKPMDALRRALDDAAENSGMVPCYYMEVKREGIESLYYLSPSSIGRVRQRKSWSEIMGAYSPCTRLETGEADEIGRVGGVCPACALFGTAEAESALDESKGAGGRLRFTDANAVSYCMNSYTLPILGTPKPTAFEFYLRKPNDAADFWNFDYYGIKKGRDRANYFNLETATPRGRKMYWHSQPQSVNLEELERPDLSVTMETVDSGEFLFRIYFDGITEQQRQDLLWIIELGDNRPDSPMQHKLGHAKPIGYGSVKLTVESCVRRMIRIEPEPAVLQEPLPVEPETVSFPRNSRQVQALLRLCDTRITAGKRVAYPVGKGKNDEDWKVYAWFSHNRTNPAFTLVLPEPTEAVERLSLPTERMTADTSLQQTVLTQKDLNEQLLEEHQRAETVSAFERAKQLYPVGRILDAQVHHAFIKQNQGTLFVYLEDVPYQVIAKYIPGKKSKYWEGKPVKLRITGVGENRDGEPNFVAEIVK